MSDVSLYDRLTAAGFEIDHHESDLYVRVTPESRAIIDAWMADNGYGEGFRDTFTSQVDGHRYFDVPFAYQPYWEARTPAPAPAEEESAPTMGM